jgi:hypothetical protein
MSGHSLDASPKGSTAEVTKKAFSVQNSRFAGSLPARLTGQGVRGSLLGGADQGRPYGVSRSAIRSRFDRLGGCANLTESIFTGKIRL